jgi:hypothetical protein
LIEVTKMAARKGIPKKFLFPWISVMVVLAPLPMDDPTQSFFFSQAIRPPIMASVSGV